MKGLIKFLLISVSVTSLMVACGKDDKNSGGHHYDPFPPITPGAMYYQNYRGTVQITDRSHYQTYLKENYLCSTFIINTCAWTDRNPVMGLQFRGKDVHPTYGIGASVIIEVLQDNGYGSGVLPYYTYFYSVNDDTQLEGIIGGFAGTPSYNAEIIITVTGEPGDQSLQATLQYRGKVFGQVQLNKYQPYGYYPN